MSLKALQNQKEEVKDRGVMVGSHVDVITMAAQDSRNFNEVEEGDDHELDGDFSLKGFMSCFSSGEPKSRGEEDKKLCEVKTEDGSGESTSSTSMIECFSHVERGYGHETGRDAGVGSSLGPWIVIMGCMVEHWGDVMRTLELLAIWWAMWRVCRVIGRWGRRAMGSPIFCFLSSFPGIILGFCERMIHHAPLLEWIPQHHQLDFADQHQ